MTDVLGAPSQVRISIADYERPFPISDDISLVWSRDDFLQALGNSCQKDFWKVGDKKGIESLKSVDCTAMLILANEDEIEGVRANICLCGGGEFITGRFRIPGSAKFTKKETKDVCRGFGKIPEIELKGVDFDTNDRRKDIAPFGAEDFFFQNDTLASVLTDVLEMVPNGPTKKWSPPHGLLLISGATNSCKTVTTHAVLVHYLRYLLSEDTKKRNESKPEGEPPKLYFPHFVTFEDPREKWGVLIDDADASQSWIPDLARIASRTYDQDELEEAKEAAKSMKNSKLTELGILEEWERWNAFSPVTAPHLGFNFTVREKGKDVDSLHNARMDAMRQTPKCFIIGEIREDDDWIDAIELAGTGHLVVATTHAGSISESFSRLFAANKIKTEAERGFIARRMLGAIHLHPEKIKIKIDGDDFENSAVFPRVWKRTPQSISAMVAVGLSSLIPNGEFFFSRTHIIEKYQDAVKEDLEDKDPLCWTSSKSKDSLAEWIKAAKSEIALDDILNS